MSASRTAGALLLLTALATAISVLFRLSAGADQTPMAESLGQSMGLDSERIAQLAAAETLSAIGAAKSAYAAGGAARLVAGLALLAASIPLWRVAGPYHARAMGLAAALLAASGIISAVSGGCAMALAALAAETQSSVALVPGADLIGRVEDTLLTMRWAFGALGFTLGGLGLVALAPVQWRIGGRVLRVSAVVFAVLGVAMLLIWVDAATVFHRITGIGFLIWLIAAGLWLIAGRTRPPPRTLP